MNPADTPCLIFNPSAQGGKAGRFRSHPALPRGQCVFLFEPEGLPRSVDAASIVVALQRDPPGPLPNHCQGYLRPGTDGDFAELAIRDPDRKCRLLHSLA